MDKLVDNKMINKIEKLLQEARTHVAVEVNNTLPILSSPNLLILLALTCFIYL